MAKYVIEGGTPLQGNVSLLGAKNVGFKMLIAALLCDGPSQIDNIPHINDIEVVMQVIGELGGKVSWIGDHKIQIDPAKLDYFKVNSVHGDKTRAPTLFVGPLVSKFGKAIVPLPGGDAIGKRPLERHIAGFKALGLTVTEQSEGLEFSGNLTGGRYRFEKNSHTGTESLILAAVRANGKTTIENAAAEPEVVDLISFLNRCGAAIRRTSPRTIEIEGKKSLSGAQYKIMPDRNEAVTFACAALVTGGNINILEKGRLFLGAFEKAMKQAGTEFELSAEGLHVRSGRRLKATKITTAPHPGFMTDWQPLWATVMTQASGTSEIHETIFESRFSYLDSLRLMGADVQTFEPEVANPGQFYNFNWGQHSKDSIHAVKITGPTQLLGKNIDIADIRAGATLTLAALAAKGESNLSNIVHIERGYEKLEERLEGLGARIRKEG
jgi:UDP-N-acetylglucosamine 1-carboxyvinyltransferase